MSYQKTTPSGDVYTVPERGDPNWGENATAILDRSLDSLLAGDVIITNELVITPLEVTVSDGDILNQIGSSMIILTTDGADATLDEVTPVQSPTDRNGKILRILNVDETYVVNIPDAGNMDINGGITLGYLHYIELQWIEVVGVWIEAGRNN